MPVPGRDVYKRQDPGSTLVRLEAYIRADGSDPADLYSSIINRSDVRIWSLDDAAFSYFRQAVEELSACRAGYLEAASAYLTLLLTELLRQNNSYLSSSDQKESKSTLEFQIAAQIDVFFSENYNQPVTIDDLSEYLNVSSRQAQRLVYRYCGTTFRQKIIFIRMEFAKRYLEETKLPIAQISELIGYEYPSSFCKAFYKQLGLTPDSYRRQVHESINAVSYTHLLLRIHVTIGHLYADLLQLLLQSVDICITLRLSQVNRHRLL